VTAACADDDIFHVLVSDDDMKRMNVDQLADAFRLSVIDASTLVWQTGMNGWRRLGSIADVEPEEEELETAVLWAAPPPPPPVRAPQRRATSTFRGTATYQPPAYQPPVYQPPVYQPPAYPPPVAYQEAAPYGSPASYFEQAAYQPAPPAYEAPETYPVAVEPWAQSEPVSPVYSPALPQPDPYVLPKRRAEIPDTIDFRRAPGSIRWGRWLVATLVLSSGLVVAYRQNLLRDGARAMGIESSYLAAERRATAFVSAKASPSVKSALTRLALLPGPNANAEAAPEPASLASKPAAPVSLGAAPAVAAPPCVAELAEPAKAPEPKPEAEAEVKTVSLSSLPVLGGGSRAKSAEPSEPSEPARSATPRREVDAEEESPRRSKKQAREEATEEPRAKARAKANARAADEDQDEEAPKAKRKQAKAEAALPPPPKDGNPLKAAMWSAVASDTKKLAARKQRD